MSSLADLVKEKETFERHLNDLLAKGEDDSTSIEVQELKETISEIEEQIKKLKSQSKKSGRRKTRKVKKKHSRRRGAGGTALDPNVHKQNPPSELSRKPGSTADLAQKALDEQAKRRAAAQEEPKRKGSDSSTASTESTASDPKEFQENPLQTLKGRKSQVSDNFRGKVEGKTDPDIRYFGHLRETRNKPANKGGRKTRRRKTRHRR